MTENNKNNITSVDKKMLGVLKALQKGVDYPNLSAQRFIYLELTLLEPNITA